MRIQGHHNRHDSLPRYRRQFSEDDYRSCLADWRVRSGISEEHFRQFRARVLNQGHRLFMIAALTEDLDLLYVLVHVWQLADRDYPLPKHPVHTALCGEEGDNSREIDKESAQGN
jgi:hypothetical protein